MCKDLYYLNKNSDKIIIYLHGGPFFNILTPSDNPFAYYFLKKKVNTVILNYPTIIGDGGITDYNYIYHKILALKSKYSNAKFYLIGESYGGFLASLFASQKIFKQIICLSSFISVNYQLLFSPERVWLSEYLNKDSKDFYFLYKNSSINVPIVFINGKEDKQIPWQQFIPLIKLNYNNIRVKLLDNFTHREYGKKLDFLLNYLNNIIL